MSSIKSICVTGGSGQLGRSIKGLVNEYPQYSFAFPAREQLELSDPSSIADYFENNTVDLIINCAAHTAVDKAESEPELVEQLNHLAVKQLAQIALKKNAKLIHLSTDYVFAGTNHRPYTESDVVAPQGVYGLSKLKGEQAVQQTMLNNAIIIRTSWVYSEFGSNFVKTMLRLGQQKDELGVIYDQVGTPTYAGDLALVIMQIAQSSPFKQPVFGTNVYHYSHEGVCSWYDFAIAIFELSGVMCFVKPIETKDYQTPATRPHYSVLNKAKIKQTYAINIPYWKEALQRCLHALQEKSL